MNFSDLTEKLKNKARSSRVVREYVLDLCDGSILLQCLDFEPPELMFSSIRSLMRTSLSAEADERICCFLEGSDSLAAFLPEELSSPEGRFVFAGPDGRLAASIQFGFLSLYSEREKTTFVWLCPDKHSLDGFVSHPFHMEFSWWAQRNGLLFLHSACVGTENAGVLFSGAGGSGKSTLALSALLSGMRFLSDDYLLIKGGPPPEAIRLYSSAYLTEDMLEKLPEYKEKVYWKSDLRRKNLIDLCGFEGLIADRMPLKALIIPRIAHAAAPAIERNADIRTLIPLLSSTSYQNRELRNKELFQNMMRLLKGLPAYHFYLTDDIRRNAAYLSAWLEDI